MTDRRKETVYITGPSIPQSQCYHTNRDCTALYLAETVRERTRGSCEGAIPICGTCTNNNGTGHLFGTSSSHHIAEKLARMNPEEVLQP